MVCFVFCRYLFVFQDVPSLQQLCMNLVVENIDHVVTIHGVAPDLIAKMFNQIVNTYSVDDEVFDLFPLEDLTKLSMR